MNLCDLHWAAGFLEGEGSFVFHGTSPAVNCAQVQLQPLKKLHEMFGGSIITRHLGKDKGWKEQNYWYRYGAAAIGIMMTLYPLLSKRRQEQILPVINKWKERASKQPIARTRKVLTYRTTSLCNKEDI